MIQLPETDVELFAMSEDDFLKILIHNTEERYLWYRDELAKTFKDKDTWPAGDLTDWYKEHLKEMKNSQASKLKILKEEITNIRQGLNPPYCYKYSA